MVDVMCQFVVEDEVAERGGGVGGCQLQIKLISSDDNNSEGELFSVSYALFLSLSHSLVQSSAHVFSWLMKE